MLIFSFSISCGKTYETTKKVNKDIEEAESISNEKSENEIAINDEKIVEAEKIPTLEILSVAGVDSDNNIFDSVNNTINGNINLIVVTFKTENFNINEDKIETIWELDSQEVYRSAEVINDTDDTYKVGVSMSEGSFYSGAYKCNIYLNNSLINVEYGANWTFNITQPRSFDVKGIPYEFNGSSSDISDLILIDGLVEINYNYSGSGNFVVYLLNEYGDQLELLVNEIDTTSGSTTFKGDGSKYFVSVELADGNYNFNIDYK